MSCHSPGLIGILYPFHHNYTAFIVRTVSSARPSSITKEDDGLTAETVPTIKILCEIGKYFPLLIMMSFYQIEEKKLISDYLFN